MGVNSSVKDLPNHYNTVYSYDTCNSRVVVIVMLDCHKTFIPSTDYDCDCDYASKCIP